MLPLLAGLVLGSAAGAALTQALTRRHATRSAALPAPPEREPDPSLDALAVHVTPEMVRCSNERYALYFAGAAWSGATLLFLLESGISARIGRLAGSRMRHPVLKAALFLPLVSLVQGTLLLPLAVYAGYRMPKRFALSNQSAGEWLLDSVKGFAVSTVLGVPALALLYWTLRRSPRRWWLGFWLASIPLLALLMLLGPLVIDPIFNRFEPLRDAALRERLLELAERAGIPRSRVFQVDASRRTEALNAYVTGLGGSARIVLWDTLLAKLEPDEIAAVMAHEMAHYVEGHVPQLFALSVAGSLVALRLTDALARRLLACCGSRWGIEALDDLASYPVLLLVLGAMSFFATPFEAAVSRWYERRADRFCLQLTGDGQSAASAFVKLSERNLTHPDPPPLLVLWMFSHPPLRERIRTALAWDVRPGQEPA